MNKNDCFVFQNSWKECEKILFAIAEGRLSVPNHISKEKKLKDSVSFLNNIGYCKNGELTKDGEEYYKNKLILNDQNNAKVILRESIKKYEPTQLICQTLWGKESLTRDSVHRLLLLKRYINPIFKSSNLSSFLMLLNHCEIIKYSKKFNKITILYNPLGKDEAKASKRFLSPETPYTNIKILRECLRESEKYIWWLDKHFSMKGLEPLSEEADGTRIKEIKILAGITDKINNKLKKEFSKFQIEMKSRGIETGFRVIRDKILLHKIHGRWIISKSHCFNIPPIDSIYKGQYDEITKTNNRPPFEEFWNKGLDLLRNWDEVNRLKQALS